MGTRNLTAVYLDGQYKVAQYGQWDGYPEGQGITALTFLRDKMDLELFKEALRNSSYIPSEELTALWKQYGADENGWITMEDSDRMMEIILSLAVTLARASLKWYRTIQMA